MVAEGDKLVTSGTDFAEMSSSLQQNDELMDAEDPDEEKIADWIRCTPADLYFKRNSVSIASYRLSDLTTQT